MNFSLGLEGSLLIRQGQYGALPTRAQARLPKLKVEGKASSSALISERVSSSSSTRASASCWTSEAVTSVSETLSETASVFSLRSSGSVLIFLISLWPPFLRPFIYISGSSS